MSILGTKRRVKGDDTSPSEVQLPVDYFSDLPESSCLASNSEGAFDEYELLGCYPPLLGARGMLTPQSDGITF